MPYANNNDGMGSADLRKRQMWYLCHVKLSLGLRIIFQGSKCQINPSENHKISEKWGTFLKRNLWYNASNCSAVINIEDFDKVLGVVSR